jgi:Family of unknown function (DUF5682)
VNTGPAAASVPGPRVHLLGVRHHGPGSAATLVRALDELRPARLLLELPADTSGALALAATVEPVARSAGGSVEPDPDCDDGADRGLVPPVALLGYVVDHPERAAFHPLARFSPEWQALRWAARRSVPVEPIDLPLGRSLAAAGDRRSGALVGPDAIGLLARAGGYDDAERWWEDVVEHRGADGATDDGPAAVAAFAAVAEAMAAVREGHEVPEGVEGDREAAMRQAVRRALVQRPAGDIAVVCGAWHTPALGELGGRSGEAADRARLRGGARVKVAVTWVPWTYRRLASASGYGAGVSSPGWYDHVFAHPGPDGTARWFAGVAAALRHADLATSPDHVIAAVRLADALAGLRDRPRPGLGEALDAVSAVFADGRRGPLALIEDHLVVGDRLGRVPPSAPMVPLARDVARQQSRARLRPEAGTRHLDLDLRRPLDRDRSLLLHRLAALGIRWGRPGSERGSSGTFRESWALRWEPELEIRLVEASAQGTTLVAAATARLVERAGASATLAARTDTGAAAPLAVLTDMVELALRAELGDAVEPLMTALAERAAVEQDAAGLLDALGPLARTLRYGDVRGTDLASLRSVLDGLVVRVVVGLPGACRALDDDSAAAMAERLSTVQGALALVDHPARRGGWPAVLALVAAGDRGGAAVHGTVQGRAVRLLHDAGAWAPPEVETALSRALSVGTAPARGAAFVEGFLAGSGTVLLHDIGLVRLLDRWVAGLGAQPFVDVVPLLRRTFGGFDEVERRRLGQLVAQDLDRLEASAASSSADETAAGAEGEWLLDPARADAALRTVTVLLGAQR